MGIQWYKKTFLIAVISTVLWILPAEGQTTASHEYKVKSVFIYRFINFVEGWKFETKGNEDSNEAITIGIMGEDPFEDAFEPLKDRHIKGRKVTIKYFNGFSEQKSLEGKSATYPDLDDIKGCDVIFVCPSEKNHIDNILNPIRNESILTIADTQGFLEKGGIINFIIDKNKVKFDINTAGAKRAKLTLRAKLLRLAKRVIEEDDVKEE